MPSHRLLQHLDLFLKVSHGDLGPHIGILLREIFAGSPAICLSVKEIQIKKMMALVFARGKEAATETNVAMIDGLLGLLMVSLFCFLWLWQIDMNFKH